jgi:YD repeat-containing protein
MHYDEQGRLTSVALPAVPGSPSGSPDVSPVYTYAYNASGNQTLLRDPLGHETRFTFDAEGRQTQRQLPLAFGADGRLGTADDAQAAAFAETFAYDPQGRPSRHVSFEGAVKRSEYDPATGRLVVERFFDNAVEEAANNPASTLSSTYDEFGRVVRQTRVSGAVTEVWSWSFDAEGRVTRAVSPTGTIGYEYDPLGRKTRTWSSDVPAGALADPLAELASDTRYEYDAFGRLATLRVLTIAGETLSGTEIQTTRYQYDLEGRLLRQTNPNGTIALHAYDTLGRLTKLTHYVPDSSPQDLSNNAKLAEFDDEHNVVGQRTSTTETFWFDGADPDTLPEPHTSEIDWTCDAGRLGDVCPPPSGHGALWIPSAVDPC